MQLSIVGDPEFADTQTMLDVVRNSYRPLQVLALDAPGAQLAAVPLLQDRGLVDGQASAYVCRDCTREAPITTPEALEGLLNTCREGKSVASL